ncbi:hypothetical protein [Stenotrophomonas sp. PS02289]|uniref:hypothetical protein n=1 Tax=Stenotrophomonas sp. PS02289 TaxID=2991422 RepID=UPI00249CEB2E|nr:hypothetical protein [Stenotrophomonas sp. PS02289]
MAEEDLSKVADANSSVVKALMPLSPEERARVVQSVVALFGISAALPPPRSSMPTSEAAALDSLEPARQRQATGKPISLVELLKEKNPTTNAQRIACFAYYREQFEGNQHFSKSDLQPYFAKAKLTSPGPNYARDYNNAVKSAWIHDEGSQSYLTQVGEAAVESGFSGSSRKAAPAKRKKKSVGKVE